MCPKAIVPPNLFLHIIQGNRAAGASPHHHMLAAAPYTLHTLCMCSSGGINKMERVVHSQMCVSCGSCELVVGAPLITEHYAPWSDTLGNDRRQGCRLSTSTKTQTPLALSIPPNTQCTLP